MQDRYVGDVGDFGKFALLRALALTGLAAPRLGVAWYRFPDESHNGDGRHTGYLRKKAFAELDGDLSRAMSTLVDHGPRSLVGVQNAGILPEATLFFGDSIAPVHRLNRADRLAHRDAWLRRALQTLETCDIVFLDPDNGIEVKSVPRHHAKAGKYVFWEELLSFWRRGQSLVLYHHLNRTAPAEAQAKSLIESFHERLGPIPLLVPLLFRRGSCRLFLVAAQTRHASFVDGACRRFVHAGWIDHFTIIGTTASIEHVATGR